MALPWGGLLCPHILGTVQAFLLSSCCILWCLWCLSYSLLFFPPLPYTQGRLGLSRLTPVLLVSQGPTQCLLCGGIYWLLVRG